MEDDLIKIYWYLGHEQFQPEVVVEHAVLAEKAGFDGVLVSEHFHPWVDDVGAGGFAFATLGAIASATRTLDMMTAVTTPLWRYHPAVVAQAAATLSRLSGGRFALGVGTGENINEGPLGYEFPAYAERAGRMREALEIITRLLDGEKLDYAGQYYRTDAAKLYSPPIVKVPLLMAAGGPKSAALAGSSSDGVIASVKSTEETLTKVVAPAGAAAIEVGRALPTLVAMHWSVRGKNDDEAWYALKPWRGLRAPNRLTETDPRELQRGADALPRDEVMSRYSRVESASDYIRIYGHIVTQLAPDILGIQTTSVDQAETLQMIGRDVLPALRNIAKKGE